MLKKALLGLISVLILSSISLSAQAQRGCCSHHGGVNYCDREQGRQVCRDGSYSPTCGCERSSNADANQNNKEAKK